MVLICQYTCQLPYQVPIETIMSKFIIDVLRFYGSLITLALIKKLYSIIFILQ